MKLMQTLKSKKGFTLMELIIVIVILAILVAALVPTFIGFVDRSRQSEFIAETRVGMTAAQAIVTRLRGNDPDVEINGNAILRPTGGNAQLHAEFKTIIGTDARDPEGFSDLEFDTATNRVTGIRYYPEVNNPQRWDVLVTRANGTVVTQRAAPPPGG